LDIFLKKHTNVLLQSKRDVFLPVECKTHRMVMARLFRFSFGWEKSIVVAVFCALFIFTSGIATGQDTATTLTDTLADRTDEQWYLGDPVRDKVPGISLDKAYQHLAGRTGKRVVVAILDSGIDTSHVDIKEKLWVNSGEIPGNGIDDDGNGLVDDIHGWNYLGNSDGEVVAGETLEMTRLLRKLRKEFSHMHANSIPDSLQEEYALYLDIKETYEEKYDDASDNLRQFDWLNTNLGHATTVLERHFKRDDFTISDVAGIRTNDERLSRSRSLYLAMHGTGLANELESLVEHYRSMLTTKLNLDHNARVIIGDNIYDLHDSIFGNNDLDGTTPGHGTSVSGLVGAVRNNGMGIDGVADDVALMIVRVVPGGDEYDKDVALGIRYAVNHGAQIINCSFGKEYSPQKWMVDEAIRYAEQHGVLIVHAAGNSSHNNDEGRNFPTPYYDDGGRAANWIEVGASTRHSNKKLIASFSNYGAERVDLFAPGEDIVTLEPGSQAKSSSGTSLAAPVVTGVAAMLLSYFPELTPEEIRTILMASVTPYGKKRVIIPGSKKRTRMRNLCVAGGVVNAYQAVIMAEELVKEKNREAAALPGDQQ
jgi:subtilisin family serine protease